VKLFLLFLLLFIPSTASAASTYDLSCDNVARIRIGRLNAAYWNIESSQGCFHIVDFELKPAAAEAYVELLRASPWVSFLYRGEETTKRHLSLTAGGKPLRDDAPALAGFSNEGIAITIIREKDAFDTARSVCPALVPRKVVVDWQRDWEQGGSK